MKCKRLLIFCPLFPLLFGCVAPINNYHPAQKNISVPPEGSTNIAYVGETMLRQGVFVESDAIFLPRGLTNTAYSVSKGYYLKIGENESYEFYNPSFDSKSGRVVVAQNRGRLKAIAIHKGLGRIYCISANNARYPLATIADYERKKYQCVEENSFQQALIYSGRVGSKINIGYREFSNDLARPAFNNDVEYDLSESNVIGYKGARLEVLEATNEEIKYKVLRNFNLADIRN